MTWVFRSFVSCVAAGSLVVAMSACSPGESEIKGGGGSSAVEISEGNGGLRSDLPLEPSDLSDVVTPKDQGEVDNMPAVIDETQVKVDEGAVSGFTEKQLQEAAAWAAAFTQTRFDRSGLWVAKDAGAADPLEPVTYFGFTTQMTPKAQKRLYPMLFGTEEVEANQATLNSLVPLPPRVEGKWMTPGVGNFAFGQPAFMAGGAGANSVNIAFPYSAYAVYGDERAGKYWAIELRGKAAYTLVLTKSGWLIDEWAGSLTYGDPQTLPGPPEDRFFFTLPDELRER